MGTSGEKGITGRRHRIRPSGRSSSCWSSWRCSSRRMAGRAAYAGRRSRRETGQGRDGDPGRSRQQAGRTRTGCGAPCNSPDCPDTDCISMLVNGDLLFHPNLWKHFAGANTAATDGTAFDFTPLFETMKPYIQRPTSPCASSRRRSPNAAVPTPAIRYSTCRRRSPMPRPRSLHRLHARHQPFMGSGCRRHRPPVGYARVQGHRADRFVQERGGLHQAAGHRLAHGRGKLGLVTGTVSLNGMTADHDWQVDRLREAGDPQHQSDIDRAVAKAKAAREQRRRGGHGHAFGAGIHRLRRFVAGLRGA